MSTPSVYEIKQNTISAIYKKYEQHILRMIEQITIQASNGEFNILLTVESFSELNGYDIDKIKSYFEYLGYKVSQNTFVNISWK
jgi:hypothetical protein